jgi:hypothetical protein
VLGVGVEVTEGGGLEVAVVGVVAVHEEEEGGWRPGVEPLECGGTGLGEAAPVAGVVVVVEAGVETEGPGQVSARDDRSGLPAGAVELTGEGGGAVGQATGTEGAELAGVPTREQRRMAQDGLVGLGVGLLEAHALTGEAVEVGAEPARRPIGAQAVRPQGVEAHHHDAVDRWIGRGPARSGRGQADGQQEPSSGPGGSLSHPLACTHEVSRRERPSLGRRRGAPVRHRL